MMPITDAYWALLATPGGDDVTSASVTWRFPRGLNITAQAGINGLGTAGGYYGQLGVTDYVQSGQYHTTSYAAVFFMHDVTEVEISAWSFDGWIGGGACAYVWE
jgi:hypothetical protein